MSPLLVSLFNLYETVYNNVSCFLAECRALYAFDGAEEGELSLKAGDTLVVHHGVAETGWLYGQRGDEFGWFPSTYVEVKPEAVHFMLYTLHGINGISPLFRF